MNKRLFLSELGQRLEDIPYREAMRVLNYYEEAIDDRIEDGMSEEAAVEAMGSVDDIAREILGENEVNETAEAAEEPAKTMAETVMETEKESGSNPFFSFEYDSNKKRGSFKTGGNDGDPSRAARVFEANKVNAIRVEELAGDLEVSASSDGRIHVESEDWRGLSCELLEDGTLAVSRRRVRKNGKFLGISFDFDYAPTGDVRILLPEEYEGSFAVSTLSGDVRIRDVSPDALRLKTLSGDVSLARVSVYSLELATVSGDAEADECAVAGPVSVNSTSGDLDLRIGTVVTDGHFETISGDLDVTLGGGEDCYAIRIKDGVSPEVVYGNLSGNPLVLRTVSGDIELSFSN